MAVADQFQRVLVWSAALRLSHALLAVSVLTLLASAWALAHVRPEFHAGLRAVHVGAGYMLAPTLVFRLYRLATGAGPERWRALLPAARPLAALTAMLRFYVSGGRAALPAYYAHNPLWGPLYLLMFVLLAFAAGTGLWLSLAGPEAGNYYQAMPWLAGYTLTEWHRATYTPVLALVTAHIVAAVLHDWRGAGGDISAIINGYRIFQRRPANLDTPPTASRGDRRS